MNVQAVFGQFRSLDISPKHYSYNPCSSEDNAALFSFASKANIDKHSCIIGIIDAAGIERFYRATTTCVQLAGDFVDPETRSNISRIQLYNCTKSVTPGEDNGFVVKKCGECLAPADLLPLVSATLEDAAFEDQVIYIDQCLKNGNSGNIENLFHLCVTKVLRQDPEVRDHVESICTLAEIAKQLGKTPFAQELYEQVLQLDQYNIQALLSLDEFFIESGMHERARSYIQQHRIAFSRALDAVVDQYLVVRQNDNKNLFKLMDIIETALKKNNHDNSLLTSFIVLIFINWGKSLDSDGYNRNWYSSVLGRLCMVLYNGKWNIDKVDGSEAVQYFERALLKYPNNKVLLQILAGLYLHKPFETTFNPEVARSYLERVLEIDPKNAHALFHLAEYYENYERGQEHHPLEEEYVQRYIEVKPDDSAARKWLINIYQDKKNPTVQDDERILPHLLWVLDSESTIHQFINLFVLIHFRHSSSIECIGRERVLKLFSEYLRGSGAGRIERYVLETILAVYREYDRLPVGPYLQLLRYMKIVEQRRYFDLTLQFGEFIDRFR